MSLDAPVPDRMTVEQWADLPEDVPGELVDGQLVEEEMPNFTHEVIVTWLIQAIGPWAATQSGQIFGSEGKFGLGPRHGRKPDLSLFLDGRRPVRTGVANRPPDAMLEVISPRSRDARRDRVEKLDEYAAFGVPHYWIVDPQLRALEVFALGADGRYVHALGASSGRLDALPGCPGLVLDLDAMWAEIDKLDEGDPEG